MAIYLRPGVYVEEVPPRDPLYLGGPVLPEGRAGDGPRTHKRWMAEHGVAGFVGVTESGEPRTPVLVRNWKEFEQKFGGPVEGLYLWYAVRGFFANGGRECYVVRADPTGVMDFLGDPDERTGLEGLAAVDDIAVVAAPDADGLYRSGAFDLEGVQAVQLGLIAHAESTGRVAILDPPGGLSAAEIRDWRAEVMRYDSSFAVLYYPWLEVASWDQVALPVPPSGHLAGVYARSDVDRHVGNEPIRGVVGLALDLTLREQELLNPLGVNALLAQPGREPLVWGVRTLSSDPAWWYLRNRRVMNFLARNIRAGTSWVIFEKSHDEGLWQRIRDELEDLLSILWRTGVLSGEVPEEAYQVRCDRETNPPEAVDARTVIAECAMALHESGGQLDFRVVYYLG